MFLKSLFFLLFLAPALVFSAPLTSDLQDRDCSNTTCIEALPPLPNSHSTTALTPRADTPSLWYEYWQSREVCKDDLGGHRCLASACGVMQIVQLNGDGYTLNGQVQVTISRLSDFGVIWTGTVVARHYDGYRDGSWGVQTNVLDCATQPGPYARTPAIMSAYDWSTKRWADSIKIDVGCAWDIQIHGASY